MCVLKRVLYGSVVGVQYSMSGECIGLGGWRVGGGGRLVRPESWY